MYIIHITYNISIILYTYYLYIYMYIYIRIYIYMCVEVEGRLGGSGFEGDEWMGNQWLRGVLQFSIAPVKLYQNTSNYIQIHDLSCGSVVYVWFILIYPDDSWSQLQGLLRPLISSAVSWLFREFIYDILPVSLCWRASLAKRFPHLKLGQSGFITGKRGPSDHGKE